MTTKIAIVDDQQLLREALSALVGSEPDFEVVATYADAQTATHGLEGLDVLLVDFSLPGGGALELVTLARSRGLRVLVVSMHEEVECVRASLAAGASGYVLKSSAERVLIEAIHLSKDGRQRLDGALVDAGPSLLTSAPAELSERERAVLVELAQGHSYKDIASKLAIGPRTVETYRRRISEKLGIKTRADFLRYALEMRLIARPR